MSGGGVFDRQGHIVAIHGSDDKYPKGSETSIGSERMAADFSMSFGNLTNALVNQKLGINRGISCDRILHQSNHSQARLFHGLLFTRTDFDSHRSIR
jgi:hypothetical protein